MLLMMMMLMMMMMKSGAIEIQLTFDENSAYF